ncbi:MAG: type II toxin-antitoxin system HicB family antitoxin [Vicinamibacterales bacterium]
MQFALTGKSSSVPASPYRPKQPHLEARAPAAPYNCAMGFDDYKVVLYRQDDGSWVAEIPALGGCYALMDTREAALAELQQVFDSIAQEHRDRGQALPKDTTEIMHA